MTTKADYIRLAGIFREHTGRFPSRLDWRGENLIHWRTLHGVYYPHASSVANAFRGWGRFMLALGQIPNSTRETGTIAVNHVAQRYQDVEVMPGPNGVIDCFIGDERVEVKGATLGMDDKIHTPRWRFRLHHREYSLLVDRVILVGIAGGRPVIEWSFDRVDSVIHLDHKDALSITARQAFGGGRYAYEFYETFREDLTYEELLTLESMDE